MGSINVRSGKLLLDFRFKGERCREQTKLTDSPANKKRAKQILERIEAEITLGTFKYWDYFPNSKKADLFRGQRDMLTEHTTQKTRKTLLFKEFAELWFDEKKIEWRNSHVLSVRNSIDVYSIPYFGEKEVGSITKADILNFRSTLAKEPKRKNSALKPASINKIMTPLRMIINEAADRYEFTSPWKGIKSLKIMKTDIDPFSLDQVNLIIQSVRRDFKNYFTVRFFTGMRTGEVDGLKWKYVDFEKRQILIRETWVKGEFTYTKTDGSQREIYMSQPVYDALKAQYKMTHDQDLVFCNIDGTPLKSDTVTKRIWYPLLRLLDLKKRRPYQTRHTAATLWLASGENPEWIARQMGHTTTEMLFRVYSRYVPNLTRQDGSAFDRLLQRESAALLEISDLNSADGEKKL